MASIYLSLPNEMEDWVHQRGQTEPYRDANDYIKDLIRRDQERETKIKAMQKLVDEAFESGVSDKSADDIFEETLTRHQNQ